MLLWTSAARARRQRIGAPPVTEKSATALERTTGSWRSPAHKIEERFRTLDVPSLVREDYDRHTYREFAAMMGASRTAAGLAAGESRAGPMPAQE
jgi:hypothetical protein